MRRRLIPIFTALILLCLTTSVAFAGNPRFTGATKLSTGSVIATGFVTGLVHDAQVVVNATGRSTLTCKDDEGNHIVHLPETDILLKGSQTVKATSSTQDRIPFRVETDDIDPSICPREIDPDDTWSVTIDSMNGITVDLLLKDGTTTLDERDFSHCKTNGTKLHCRHVKEPHHS